MTDEAVLYERKGKIVYITMNRPEKVNAFNTAIAEGLTSAWKELVSDDEAWVAILTGAGNRAFCAGIDFNDPGLNIHAMPGIGVDIWKPLIAAVRGHCLGAGLVLAMQCDMRIAASDAQFGYPEARVGMSGGIGAGLIKFMPPAIAMQLLFTADPISAQRAYEVGFINKVVPPDDLIQEATKIGETISENAPLVIRGLKELAYRGSHLTLREAHAMAECILEPIQGSENASEGPRAFMEKRKPEFKGK